MLLIFVSLQIRVAGSTAGGPGRDLFKGPRSQVLGLVRGLVDVQVTVRLGRRLVYPYTEEHLKEVEKWLQEKMRINEESELVFKNEFEKEEDAEREKSEKEARRIKAEKERKRKKKSAN